MGISETEVSGHAARLEQGSNRQSVFTTPVDQL